MSDDDSEQASGEPALAIRGIDVLRTATKELRKIPLPDRDRIIERIEAFAASPSSPEHDVKRLKVSKSLRLRVGDYRVVLKPGPGGKFILERVAHRSEAYR